MILQVEEHVQFIKKLEQKRDSSLAYHMTTHLRMNGVYWGLCGLNLMRAGHLLDRTELIEFVLSCYDSKNGGFGSYPEHDAHVLSTLSAIQVLALKDALHVLGDRREEIIRFLLSLQLADGSFQGDKWGETDTRFLYCAVSALAHLGALHCLDKELTTSWVLRCQNYDGAFGSTEGAESHAAQVFTCIGALSIMRTLNRIDRQTLAHWLAERQLPCGGLNGRPQKLEDVCYSWWVLSSLSLLQCLHYIDAEKLVAFILSAQDPDGGIADRPGNVADVFHTLFGVAGLSLLGYPDLEKVDPTYCMPLSVTQKLAIDRPCQDQSGRTE
ncbi:protein geranylgeranyltransferase type II [Malassezia yamatoensis]|uniref:Geranylgeranyl transferase type-2 subunit beta n=1 Tax=Malassezia yamatoensis TaxID=253288 RepID=A0AAJ6CHJ5_9BASI|nr:protein geranylgeranyltransferase type II [Malassezia yamatoensis]